MRPATRTRARRVRFEDDSATANASDNGSLKSKNAKFDRAALRMPPTTITVDMNNYEIDYGSEWSDSNRSEMEYEDDDSEVDELANDSDSSW